MAQKLIGPAMQLQAELRWMLRVKNVVPPNYTMHRNNKDQTAEELFNEEHNELLKSAQEWIKDTAQSCSTVAVLVAGVVFAAAYVIPGDAFKVPKDSPFFWIFTCMDLAAISCSLSSVALNFPPLFLALPPLCQEKINVIRPRQTESQSQHEALYDLYNFNVSSIFPDY
ncbi:unnamed protein product [Prunus armeniaca]|uniref:PGG domain-containing protein n=1 Tax=Prunus armeniaca TaxID=36596 RepID=A0A6J5UIE3_PRUAR|nr:unnamed protein product [Prunus armeniaca]